MANAVRRVDSGDTWGVFASGSFIVYPGGLFQVADGGNFTATSVDIVTVGASHVYPRTPEGSLIVCAAADSLAFFGGTPGTRPASANQAALTPVSNFTGSDTVDKAAVLAAVQGCQTLANALRTALVALNLIKGAA